MSSEAVSYSLSIAPTQLNIYLGCFIYIIGVIGSIGNIIVYSSRSLRDRAYSIYLLSESLVDFCYLNFVLLTRILQKGFRITITSNSDALCRIRQFSSNYGNQLAFTFLALATLDRILLAQRSSTYRQWGNRCSLAKKLVAMFLLFWFVALCHRLIWYSASNGRCDAQAGAYAYFDNMFDAIVTCMFPMITLTILGILIGRSIRRVTQRQVGTTGNETVHISQSVINKIDTQLTVMLFLDISVAMISFIPYAAHLLYVNITNNWPKSPLRTAWETIIIELIRILSYLFFSCSFYVSFFAFSGFRHHFFRSLGIMKQPTNTVTCTGGTLDLKVTRINTNNNINL